MYSKEEIEENRNHRFVESFRLYECEDILRAAELIKKSDPKDVDTCSDYDAGYTEFTIHRPETDEEVITRLNWQEEIEKRRLESLRKQYEDLKKMFESK